MFAYHTKIMKEWNWVSLLSLWLMFSLPLFSQTLANHTVTIRIVRPNGFNVKPIVSAHSSPMENETVQMEWETGKRPKKITASIVSGALPVVIEAKEMGEKWMLSPNDEKEIFVLRAPSTGNTEWMCKIKAVQSGTEATPPVIMYTMVEM